MEGRSLGAIPSFGKRCKGDDTWFYFGQNISVNSSVKETFLAVRLKYFELERKTRDRDAGSGGKSQIQESRLILELGFLIEGRMENCNVEKIRVQLKEVMQPARDLSDTKSFTVFIVSRQFRKGLICKLMECKNCQLTLLKKGCLSCICESPPMKSNAISD